MVNNEKALNMTYWRKQIVSVDGECFIADVQFENNMPIDYCEVVVTSDSAENLRATMAEILLLPPLNWGEKS